MDVSLLSSHSLAEQVQSLLGAVDRLQAEVAELRRENAQLRRQVSELRCDVGYWKSRHADAVKRNVKLQAKLDLANAEIRQLKAERFGKRSEKQSAVRSNQLDDPQQQSTPKKKRGQQPGRPAPKRRDYSHLPAREETIDLPDEEKICACCGKPLSDLGHNDEVEQLEIETVVYRKVIRRKRCRRTCNCRQQPRTVTAPAPPKLLPKSRYGTSLWTHLLLEKFHLQRPTQRTIEQLETLGLSLAAGTIAAGMKRIEPLMAPIYEAIRKHHVLSAYFHADETRWKVFVEKAGKIGHCWWLWLFAGEDSVIYVLDSSRSHDVPESHFPDAVEGVLMVDRYSGYKAMQQVKDGKLALAFCWAHVRRDFVRVGKGYPERLTQWALQWLDRIRTLYQLNRQRLSHPPGSSEFTTADALLREHVQSLAANRDLELADPKLHEACRKALDSLYNHWSGLTLFVDDPRIPLDNNFAERLIRGPAVGRKNYYGSGAEWSGQLAMMMFSIFATLKMWNINPRVWLTWYFTECANNNGKAASDPESFLPWNISESRLTELRNESQPNADDSS